MAKGFWNDFRWFFTRGLAAALPTILTIAMLIWLFQKIHDYVGVHIGGGAQAIASWIYSWSAGVSVQAAQVRVAAVWNEYHLDVVGFLLAIVLIYIVGLFVASFIGRAIWRAMEGLIMRLPIVRPIYAFVKPVTDFLFADKRLEFKRVVAVEYPRKGIWSIGLMTNTGMRAMQSAPDNDMITVFVPSSPTPFTGYTVTVRRSETKDLPMTIEEALRFVVSGGVILPPGQFVGPEAPSGPQLLQARAAEDAPPARAACD